MNTPDIIHLLMSQMEILAGGGDMLTQPEPLPASPWVAMSSLQKAIRRGRTDLALRAAATLLRDSPERLWRRLGVIVFEDIGVADIDVVYLATAALAGQRARMRMGGEWTVASYLISRMADAQKCRAADDLLLVANLHPRYDKTRREFGERSFQELIELAAGSGSLPERAIALWYAMGTERAIPGKFATRSGDPAATFDALRNLGLPRSAVDVAEFAHRRVSEMLCPFFPMLAVAKRSEPGSVVSDGLPPELIVRGNPSCAIDYFTREGRRAYATFAAGESDTANWLRAHIPRPRRVEVLGNMVFHAEGGRLIDRCVWATASELRHLAETGCIGVPPEIASEGLELMRRDIAVLNEVRAHG